jgi:hypothetical protein
VPNNNTIYKVGPSQALGASSTAEFQFTDSASALLIARLAPNHLGETDLSSGRFRVRAGGRVTGGTTTNFTVRLDHGSSTTIASNTTIEASTARAVDSESGNWFIEAVCYLDEVSDKIQGFGRSMVNNLYDAEAALDAEVTSADPGSEQAFTCTGQFSASDAGNAAVLEYLEIVQD